MRSLRTAAVAGASALALVFGTTTVATAEDQQVTQNDSIEQDGTDIPVEDYTPTAPPADWDAEPTLSSEINTGSSLNGHEPAQGPALFGSSKDIDSQPRWAQFLYLATVLGVMGTFFGTIVGPIYNHFVHGPQA